MMRPILTALLVACAALPASGAEPNPAVEKHWYAVTVAVPAAEGQAVRQYYGSTDLSEERFAPLLLQGTSHVVPPLLLGDLRYYRTAAPRGFRPWTEVFPHSTGRVYLNARHIVAFEPLAGDPLGKEPPRKQPPEEAPDRKPDLRIELRIEQKEYARGEPVPLTIVYTNTGPETMTLHASGLAGGGWFSGETLVVSHGDGRTEYTFLGIDPAIEEHTLEPGESWSRTIADLDEAVRAGAMRINGEQPDKLTPILQLFPLPARYTLGLRYGPESRELEPQQATQSNPATFTIRREDP